MANELPEIDFSAPQSQKAPPAAKPGAQLPDVYLDNPSPGFVPSTPATSKARLQRDVGRAVARSIGAPADLLEMLSNLYLAGSESVNPLHWPRGTRMDIPGSEELIKLGEKYGLIPRVSGESPVDRMSSKAVEEAVAAAGTTLSLSPLARFKSPVMSKLFGLGDDPAKTIAMSAGLGAGAGVGGEAASGIDEQARGYGMAMGTLSPLAAYGLYKHGKTFSPTNPAQQQRIAGKFLQDNVADKDSVLATVLSDYGVPGFSTTVGRAANDPGILRVEKGMVVTDPTFANIVDQMQTQNKSAMTQHIEEALPNADTNAAAAFAKSRAQAGQQRRAAAEAAAQAAAAKKLADAEAVDAPLIGALTAEQRALEQAGVTLNPTLSREESSALINAALLNAKNAAKAEGSKLYDAAAQFEDVVLPVDSLIDLRNTIQADAVKRGLTSELPKLLRTPLDDQGQRIVDTTLDDFLLSGAGKDVQDLSTIAPIMSVARLEGLRGLTKKRLRELQLAGGAESPEGRYLGQLASGIDKIFDDVAEGAYPWVPKEASEAYKAARTFYARDYKQPFGSQSPIGQALRAGQPSTTMSTFFRKGEQGGVLADALLASKADINDPVREYALDFARRAVTDRNGVVKADRLQKFNADYGEFLNRFPAVRDELKNARKAQAAIDQRRQQVSDQLAEAKKRQMDSVKEAAKQGAGEVAVVTKRIQQLDSPAGRQRWAARFFLDKDPEHAVRSVIASSDADKAIKQTVGLLKQDKSGEAMAGFQRAYMDHILSRITQRVEAPGVKAGALTKILDDERKFADAFLDKGQVRRLEQVLTAANVDLRQARKAAIVGGSGTPEGVRAASIVNDLVANRVGGPLTRRMLWLLDRSGLQASQESVKTLLREAMLDPNIMRELLTIPTNPGLNMRVPQHLMNLGARVASGQNQD